MTVTRLSARLGQFAPAVCAALMLFLVLGQDPARAAEYAPDHDGLDRAMAATVIVLDDDRPLGSAVLLTGGRAISDADVVGARGTVTLRMRDGESTRARVVAADQRRGLVLLVLEASLGEGLTLAALEPRPGQGIFAIGAPLGRDLMLARGVIVASPRQRDGRVPMMGVQHDARVSPGGEGGALVDDSGRLLGLVRGGEDEDLPGVGWATPALDLLRIVTLMERGQLRDVPELGVSFRLVTGKIADALGVPRAGLLVDFVSPGSRGAHAGLQPGDIVLAIDGVALDRVGALAWQIDRLSGTRATLSVRRGAAPLRLEMDLAPVVRSLGTAGPGLVVGVKPIGSYSFASLGVRFEDAGRVSGVNRHSPAFFAGLAPGDVVLTLNGVPVDRAALEGFAITQPVLLLVARDGSTVHLLIDPWGQVPLLARHGNMIHLDARAVLF